MLSTGMSLEEVRSQFDLPRLSAFNAYTARFPPQHILIAGYFGFGEEKSSNSQQEEIETLLANIPMVNR